jgi:mRNA deadenylase 3'-5' endonuclease subunit Ccr4
VKPPSLPLSLFLSLPPVPQPPNPFDPRAPKATFKVLTYNCLADIYATPQVGKKEKRKEKIKQKPSVDL